MAQVWLVTGSSRGLGRAIVEAGLLAGNKVLATARNIESLRELSERYDDQVKFFELDVSLDFSGKVGRASLATEHERASVKRCDYLARMRRAKGKKSAYPRASWGGRV